MGHTYDNPINVSFRSLRLFRPRKSDWLLESAFLEETMLRKLAFGLLASASALLAAASYAAQAPSELKIGTLYATSGPFASTSMQQYDGVKFWVDEMNARGGVYVKPYHKKVPIRLIAYDDQSNTATAATLYDQLITQDKVNILISDSTSVLTSVAVPIARNHKMLLIDVTGGGTPFFSKDNPYIVLTAIPVTSLWPKYIVDFLATDGAKLGIRSVAMLYDTNDFTGTEAQAVRNSLKALRSPLKLVYDHGVPTQTSSYTVIINNIRATHPDAVIEFGFPNNDIAYLRALQENGVTFNWQFANFLGIDPVPIKKAVGVQGLKDLYSYVPPSLLAHNPNFGLTLAQYQTAWDHKYANDKVPFGHASVGGYMTGLVLQKALARTQSMEQLALRKAIFSLSGKLRTLDGAFSLNAEGAQVGELLPLGQIRLTANNGMKFAVVYPHAIATGKAIYPAK